jgi:hypothetical protein
MSTHDEPTLSDRYLMLGLKLKENGLVRCMFCHVLGKGSADGLVTVNHHPRCVVVDLYVRGVERDGYKQVDAKSGDVDEEERH